MPSRACVIGSSHCLEKSVPTRSRDWPELLAPAGGPEALRAAIANGADAVYLGVEKLNARRGAQNFTLDTLPQTCRLAHVHGVSVYLAVNVLVLPDEMAEALSLVDEAWAAGVDAVIVQDLGLLRNVSAQLPHVRVHASTQMNAHNTPSISKLAALGVSRVTLAREVSIEEIVRFVAAESAEVETFVHGALCLCYSGQCLMSSLIGRRSANRGLCAQPCRLPYELLGASGEVLPTPGLHLLSPKDLAGLAELPALVATGVSALKIEGRMKSPEYVALVTGVYRAALDRAVAQGDAFEVRDGERAILAESFSRGFSEAYLAGERGNDMMSYQRPNNRGVLVGRVAAVEQGVATVALDTALEAADTIEFWTSAGRFAQAVGPITHSGGAHDAAPAGTRVELHVEQPVSSGDRVFRVRNAALSDAARRTFSSSDAPQPIELEFAVRMVVGAPVSVCVRDASGRCGTAEGPIVEPARTKSITAEEVAEHVGRLGGTPYVIGAWALELSTSAGIGFSALHRVRRDALDAYEAAVLSPWAGRRAAGASLPRLPKARRQRHPAARLVVRVADEETAVACVEAGADRAQVSSHALGAVHALPPNVEPVLPRIVRDREVGATMRWVTAAGPVVVGNLGLVGAAAAKGAQVAADWSLNALNGHSVVQLAQLGASLVWLSPELSGRQVAQIASQGSVDVGIGVYGRQELMVTEHCVLMAEGPCDQHCKACQRRAGSRTLRDRKGFEFPVRTDIAGRTHLYNSVLLDLSTEVHEIVSAGVSAIRLDLELEGKDEAVRQTRRFKELLERVAIGVAPQERVRDASTTSGHYFRGVL
jgi:U32 family peptidase